jgi:hypothetical protein
MSYWLARTIWSTGLVSGSSLRRARVRIEAKFQRCASARADIHSSFEFNGGSSVILRVPCMSTERGVRECCITYLQYRTLRNRVRSMALMSEMTMWPPTLFWPTKAEASSDSRSKRYACTQKTVFSVCVRE